MFYQPEYFGNGIFRAMQTDSVGYPLHLHKCFELVCLTGGQARAEIDGRPYCLEKGEGVLVFPHQLHSYCASSDCTARIVMFSPDLVAHFSAMTQNMLPESNRIVLDGLDAMAFDNIFETKGFLYDICAQAFGQLSFYQKESVKLKDERDLIDHILLFVAEHFQEECTLGELAQELKYNSSYLSYYVSQKIGIPFYQYVNEYRVAYACRLLAGPDITVGEAASKSGFSSTRSFNRAFRQCMAVTPSVYRKQARCQAVEEV